MSRSTFLPMVVTVVLVFIIPTGDAWLVDRWLNPFISRPETFPAPVRNRCQRMHLFAITDDETSPLRRRLDDPLTIDAASSVTQHACALLGVKSIGVDYGLVRTGVAVTVGYDPQPLATIVTSSNRVDVDDNELAAKSRAANAAHVCDEVIRYARSEQAARIIVGLPLHKNGTVAEQTLLTKEFGEQLAPKVLEELGPDVLVQWWDERYTSKEAAARKRSVDPRTSVKGLLDADAACIILANYYKENGVDAECVHIPDDVRSDSLHKWQLSNDQKDLAVRSSLEERERKIQQRKRAIAQARQEEAATGATTGKGKKKKRKKKKR